MTLSEDKNLIYILTTKIKNIKYHNIGLESRTIIVDI